MRTRALLALSLLTAAGCTLTLDPDDDFNCTGAGQCATGYRCIASRCVESAGECGDYVQDPGEECDDGGTVTEPCAYALTSCTVCDATCRVVAGATSYCGDGAIDGSNGETCDDGPSNYDAPDAACRTDCAPQRCGDGIIDTGEACDAAAANVATCPAYVATPPAGGFCTTSCAELSCPAVGYCGDGNPDTAHGETCDLGANNGVCGQTCSRDCAAWSCDREWCWWDPPALLLPNSNYDTTTAGIVRDNVTGLTWERSPAATTYTWASAKTHCTVLSLAGLSGWRLPTYIELLSIVDYSKYNPAINAVVFPGTQSSVYWSSSPYASSASYAWAVHFYVGYTYSSAQSDTYYVRCVR